jgi:hypothetical protein
MSDNPKQHGIPMLGITSEPLPMPEEMFTIIGEVVVLWSRVEAHIDQDITWMAQWPIVQALFTERPRGFAQKLDLWRKATRALYPTINVYQSYADEFKRAAKIVAKVRNHVIHGSWSLEPNDDGSFVVYNIKSHVLTAQIEPLEVSLGFLRCLINDVRNLDNYITGFVVSKMLHVHQGLLKADYGPSPEHQQSQPSLPKPSKPKRPRRSSPR